MGPFVILDHQVLSMLFLGLRFRVLSSLFHPGRAEAGKDMITARGGVCLSETPGAGNGVHIGETSFDNLIFVVPTPEEASIPEQRLRAIWEGTDSLNSTIDFRAHLVTSRWIAESVNQGAWADISVGWAQTLPASKESTIFNAVLPTPTRARVYRTVHRKDLARFDYIKALVIRYDWVNGSKARFYSWAAERMREDSKCEWARGIKTFFEKYRVHLEHHIPEGDYTLARVHRRHVRLAEGRARERLAPRNGPLIIRHHSNRDVQSMQVSTRGPSFLAFKPQHSATP
ncbi:hypothetical protein BCR39DRAFT_562591 [Naematelia encephala]|uniref:Uncharacterized protein n=1 Tax=Naematelia encephala TaxID=71784 RepID=A0A1Y2AI61_9TREE|nr:hypothetical protein BCR39DRAFT_562591 [Naematelia encephala]